MIRLAVISFGKIWPYLLGVLATFFTPIASVMTAIVILMVIDFICGLIAAKRRGDKITSRKMKDSIIKLFLYQLAIITGHLVFCFFIPGIPWVNVIAGLIGVTEILSIFENISEVTNVNFIKYIKDLTIKYLNRAKDGKKD